MRLPKNRVPVEISVGGDIVNGEVFLAEYALDHAGPERVSDLLGGPDDFFPVIGSDERVRIVARQAIRWARVPRGGIAAEEEPPPDATSIAVRVKLDDGRELAGTFLFLAPPGRTRLQDYLNDSGRFLPLFTEQSVVLIARAHLTSVAAD